VILGVDSAYSLIDSASDGWRDDRNKIVPTHHIVHAATRTGYSIGEVASRLAQLGFRPPPELFDVGEAEATDQLILSQDFNSSLPWLSQGDKGNGAGAVSTGHVIAAATQLGRPIARVARRLTVLGFTVPPILLEAGAAEPADRILVSKDLNGVKPWLPSHDAEGNPVPVPPGHIVSAAAQLGLSTTHIADRLANFGFALPAETPVQGKICPEDGRLLSLHLNGRPQMLSGFETVPLGHLHLAAARLGRSVDEVARRLTELGFQVPDTDVGVSDDDLLILSVESNGWPPWLALDRRVRSSHIVAAATGCGRSVADVARRLIELGFAVSEAILDAGDLQPGDDVLMGQGSGWSSTTRLSQWDSDEKPVPVPVGHLIAAGVSLGCSIGQVARRLTELGFVVPPGLDVLDDVPQQSDQVLVSEDLTGNWPWLSSDRVVPLGHIVVAAQHLRRTPEEVVRRLAELGFPVPRVPYDPVGPIDLLLMSRGLDSRTPEKWRPSRFGGTEWLDLEKPVPLWNLVAGAVKVDRSIVWVAGRLGALGFKVPDISGIPEVPNPARERTDAGGR
jgi:hypothetical protein